MKLIDQGESPSEAARKLSQQTGQSKRMLYALLHKKETAKDDRDS